MPVNLDCSEWNILYVWPLLKLNMKAIKKNVLPCAMALLALSLYSCKAKKIVAESSPVPPVVQEQKPAPAPVEVKKEEPAPVVEMPSFSYKNIQFEFNSAVLKTSSYATLDQIASEMKKFPSVKFNLDGHSSKEGSEARNMTLSIDRANSVKSYLINAGVNGGNLTTAGFGETKPLTNNDTEAARALNRRVEIKKQ